MALNHDYDVHKRIRLTRNQPTNARSSAVQAAAEEYVPEGNPDEPISQDASMLGLKPGEWPERLEVDGVSLTRVRFVHAAGELVYVVYQADGTHQQLFVVND